MTGEESRLEEAIEMLARREFNAGRTNGIDWWAGSVPIDTRIAYRARARAALGQQGLSPEVISLTRPGLWCDGCMTSSGVEVDVMDDSEVVATLEGCIKCETGVCSRATAG
jgi:hypothetical protein